MTDKGRILVVDDDRLVLATLAHGLQQAGFEVIDADNGDDAILQAREHRPQLALLDIRMGGKSGFDVAAYLRDVLHVPFMFLSAFSDPDTLAKANALGALDYLVKPLEVAQIVPRVEAAMGRLGVDAPPAPASTPPSPAPVHAVDVIAAAVGILMHRHSLNRRDAWQRLQRLAGEQGQPVPIQAERLLAAVEELARSGQ